MWGFNSDSIKFQNVNLLQNTITLQWNSSLSVLHTSLAKNVKWEIRLSPYDRYFWVLWNLRPRQSFFLNRAVFVKKKINFRFQCLFLTAKQAANHNSTLFWTIRFIKKFPFSFWTFCEPDIRALSSNDINSLILNSVTKAKKLVQKSSIHDFFLQYQSA